MRILLIVICLCFYNFTLADYTSSFDMENIDDSVVVEAEDAFSLLEREYSNQRESELEAIN